MTKAHLIPLVCALAAGLPAESAALGIRLADQDGRATARGNAFTATADNPSAIYYNPAGITWLYGADLDSPRFTPSLDGGKSSVPAQSPESYDAFRTRLGLYTITLGNEVNLTGGRGSFDISHRWQAAGNFYATWKKANSPVALGLGVYSPYGFGVWYPESSPIRLLTISGFINYATMNPVVAWQATKSLSIAVGPTINYAKTELKQGIPVSGTSDTFEFEGDGWALGLNAGIMWRPHPKHSFGVMYRSQTDVDFDGDARTSLPGILDNTESASAGIKFPQHVVVGYSFRPTEKWNLEANVDWTDWDNLNTVNLLKDSGPVALPFNWQSSLFYEFGASYRFDCGFVASAGYIYSENSVPNASFNPLVPDSNRHVFSVGVAKQWKKWDFDLAFQWAHGAERTVNQGTAADGTYQFDSYAISISTGHRF